MSPLMMRIFSLVGIALVAASMKARAETEAQPRAPVPSVVTESARS